MQNKNYQNINFLYWSASFSKNAFTFQQDIYFKPNIYLAKFFTKFLNTLHFGNMTFLFLNKKK